MFKRSQRILILLFIMIISDSILWASDDNYSNIFFEFGLLEIKNKNVRSGMESLQQAASLGNVEALNVLGVLLSDRPALAEQYLKKAADKGHQEAIFNLAKLYLHENKLELAEQYIKPLATCDNAKGNCLLLLGIIYMMQGDYEKAELYLKKALDKNEKEAALYLGKLYMDLNKSDLAEEFLKQAVKEESSRNYGESLAMLGGFYYAYRQNNKLAEKYLKKAIDKGVKDAPLVLAEMYIEQNKVNKAIYYYKQAIAAGDKEAAVQLAELYEVQGKHDLAKKYAIIAEK
jgi:tetratricopeptide (TPR) repeat protein